MAKQKPPKLSTKLPLTDSGIGVFISPLGRALLLAGSVLVWAGPLLKLLGIIHTSWWVAFAMLEGLWGLFGLVSLVGLLKKYCFK